MPKPVTYCTVDSCGNRCHGNGLCLAHYKRMRRHGSTDIFFGSPEHRRRVSAQLTGKKQSEETKAKRAAKMKGRIISAETRAKMADGHRKGRPFTGFCLIDGCGKKEVAKGWCHRHYDSNQYYGSPTHVDDPTHKALMCMGRLRPPRKWHLHEYAGITFRSTWEVRFAKALDALGKKWTYEPKRFPLGGCSYTPDFYLEEDDAFFEVKGWFDPKSQMKVSRFRDQYPEFPLVLVNKQILHQFERSVPMQ